MDMCWIFYKDPIFKKLTSTFLNIQILKAGDTVFVFARKKELFDGKSKHLVDLIYVAFFVRLLLQMNAARMQVLLFAATEFYYTNNC